jgi:predicted O-methyltransferase YrrM
VQDVLRVLAVGKRVAEAGTAFGEGAAAMAETAAAVVTAELDPERAAIAAERLRPFSNVELLVGDWAELLPPKGPFGLVFHDAGNFKRNPDEYGELVLGLLEPGGVIVLDDMTPGRSGPDPIRDWASSHDHLSATEILTTPSTSALVISRLS